MEFIQYKKGYKYQLDKSYQLRISVQPEMLLQTDYIQLDQQGALVIRQGYAWDGASGPAIDTPSIMRASLVHDSLYQLMREELLDYKVYRITADQLLRQHCIEDGMWRSAAWLVYKAVRLFGNPSADPANRKKAVCSPKACKQHMTKPLR